jgi:hypothetical protein
LQINNGAISVPTGPGVGIADLRALLKDAKLVAS